MDTAWSAPRLRKEAIERWLQQFDGERAINDRGDRMVGCSTSLRCLDKITLGLQPARLYLLPAYTSVGKSQLAQQVALHVARRHGPVLMASLEMSDVELTARAIAQERGLEHWAGLPIRTLVLQCGKWRAIRVRPAVGGTVR